MTDFDREPSQAHFDATLTMKGATSREAIAEAINLMNNTDISLKDFDL